MRRPPQLATVAVPAPPPAMITRSGIPLLLLRRNGDARETSLIIMRAVSWDLCLGLLCSIFRILGGLKFNRGIKLLIWNKNSLQIMSLSSPFRDDIHHSECRNTVYHFKIKAKYLPTQ